jgi:leucyl-tRNA synthetase
LGLVPVKDYAKKLINQGMILGNSAFIKREVGTDNYYSDEINKDVKTQLIHVDVQFVNTSNELDIVKLRNWQPQFKKANFETNDNKFIVCREVEKMSKSKYNVINPDDICEDYGADTLRLYEMFLGPLEQAKPWNTAGITGTYSFLKKYWNLFHRSGSFKVSQDKPSNESLKVLHKTIRKIEDDINNFSFNTSVSAFMICVNELNSLKCDNIHILKPLTILLSPFAPHICEEIWSKLGNKKTISYESFPEFNAEFIKESAFEYPVSFNGKMKFKINLDVSLKVDEIKSSLRNDSRLEKFLIGREIKKIIVVPGKIINIVC